MTGLKCGIQCLDLEHDGVQFTQTLSALLSIYGRHAGCFELSAQIAEIDEISSIEIGEIGEIPLERTRCGAPATVQLGLAVLSDLVVVSKV